MPHAGAGERSETGGGSRFRTVCRVQPIRSGVRAFQRARTQRPGRREQQALAETNVIVEKIDDGVLVLDPIGDQIENENMVIDLLDYDVRFGQGVLFSPPRPVRAGALEGTDVKADEPNATNGAEAAAAPSFTPLAGAGMGHN